MPFELGLDFGSKRYGARFAGKRLLILAKERHHYQRALSDLSGCDIKYHENEPMNLIRDVRDWFTETVTRKSLPGPTIIWNNFNDFMYYLHQRCSVLGFSEDDFERLTFAEFIRQVHRWIRLKA